jgi:hypothetical protein
MLAFLGCSAALVDNLRQTNATQCPRRAEIPTRKRCKPAASHIIKIMNKLHICGLIYLRKHACRFISLFPPVRCFPPLFLLSLFPLSLRLLSFLLVPLFEVKSALINLCCSWKIKQILSTDSYKVSAMGRSLVQSVPPSVCVRECGEMQQSICTRTVSR